MSSARVVLDLDHAARVFNGGRTILGGDPPRVLRLSAAGAVVLQRLLAGEAPTGAASGSDGVDASAVSV